ncbi:hypothetical protein Tco_0154644 [Tanacetum coccineum]
MGILIRYAMLRGGKWYTLREQMANTLELKKSYYIISIILTYEDVVVGLYVKATWWNASYNDAYYTSLFNLFFEASLLEIAFEVKVGDAHNLKKHEISSWMPSASFLS